MGREEPEHGIGHFLLRVGDVAVGKHDGGLDLGVVGQVVQGGPQVTAATAGDLMLRQLGGR